MLFEMHRSPKTRSLQAQISSGNGPPTGDAVRDLHRLLLMVLPYGSKLALDGLPIHMNSRISLFGGALTADWGPALKRPFR